MFFVICVCSLFCVVCSLFFVISSLFFVHWPLFFVLCYLLFVLCALFVVLLLFDISSSGVRYSFFVFLCFSFSLCVQCFVVVCTLFAVLN